jgi:hypothetical protein
MPRIGSTKIRVLTIIYLKSSLSKLYDDIKRRYWYNGEVFPLIALIREDWNYLRVTSSFNRYRGCQVKCVTDFHTGTRSPNKITN